MQGSSVDVMQSRERNQVVQTKGEGRAGEEFSIHQYALNKRFMKCSPPRGIHGLIEHDS